MREIKFRAWDKDLKGYIVERIFFSDGIAWIKRGDMLVQLDAEVMQYTGLKDKNGKEIWEFNEVDGKYRVIYVAPKYVLQNIVSGDIIDLYDKCEITGEYSPMA